MPNKPIDEYINKLSATKKSPKPAVPLLKSKPTLDDTILLKSKRELFERIPDVKGTQDKPESE